MTEGPTDQVVIENILFGIFKDPDLPVTRLQPKEDEPGNWDKVFKYCRSDEFKSALGFNDFLIVQIDTDVLRGGEIPEAYRLDFPPHFSPGGIIDKVAELLISLIDGGNGFWEQFGKRIIFAISVHQIECWFLPIYFKDKKAKAGKITGCIDTLNEVLPQQENGLYIHGKDLGYYRRISKHYRKQILGLYHLNPSLKIFVEKVLVKKETPGDSTEDFEEDAK